MTRQKGIYETEKILIDRHEDHIKALTNDKTFYFQVSYIIPYRYNIEIYHTSHIKIHNIR